MTKKTTIAKKSHGLGIGVGVAAAVAAAAAGAYFLYGKNGAKNRKKISGWMLKAKGEVLEKMENMQSVTKESYEQIVDKVMAGYNGIKNVDKKELADMGKQLKAMWTHIVKKGSKKS